MFLTTLTTTDLALLGAVVVFLAVAIVTVHKEQ
jgi:hypothetical protein